MSPGLPNSNENDENFATFPPFNLSPAVQNNVQPTLPEMKINTEQVQRTAKSIEVKPAKTGKIPVEVWAQPVEQKQPLENKPVASTKRPFSILYKRYNRILKC